MSGSMMYRQCLDWLVFDATPSDADNFVQLICLIAERPIHIITVTFQLFNVWRPVTDPMAFESAVVCRSLISGLGSLRSRRPNPARQTCSLSHSLSHSLRYSLSHNLSHSLSHSPPQPWL